MRHKENLRNAVLLIQLTLKKAKHMEGWPEWEAFPWREFALTGQKPEAGVLRQLRQDLDKRQREDPVLLKILTLEKRRAKTFELGSPVALCAWCNTKGPLTDAFITGRNCKYRLCRECMTEFEELGLVSRKPDVPPPPR